MTIKVRMVPHVDEYRKEESGIRRVVENYFRHLPKFDIDLVHRDTKREDFDLLAVHAGAYDGPADICHNHGLYWTADHETAAWEWRTNMRVINSIRHAKEVIVPSAWVAETFQRDMRFSPHVIPHGIDWDAWQGVRDNRGHILWSKNRIGDVCNPEPVKELAERFPEETFLSTFNLWDLNNIQVLGEMPIPFPTMREYVMSAGVYLSTTKETFSIGNLEALASGVPVLGFAYGGNLIMVEHGVNGYLAEPGNYDDLADGLNYCLKYRKVLSDNARESAKRFPWEDAVSKIADVYRLAMVDDENKPMTIDSSLYELEYDV